MAAGHPRHRVLKLEQAGERLAVDVGRGAFGKLASMVTRRLVRLIEYVGYNLSGR